MQTIINRHGKAVARRLSFNKKIIIIQTSI